MQKFTAVLLTGVLALTACAVKPPSLNTAADADRSFDGLYPFENTIVDRAWARADVDLSGYTKLKLEGAGIDFRPVKKRNTSTIMRGKETEFPIGAKERDRLRRTFVEEFTKELRKLNQFELTEDFGPEVLIVRGALIDVVSNVPPERSGRADVYLESVGEATLVIELVDAQSNAVLVRAVDRRAAETTGMPFPSNRVTNWREVTRLAQFWARMLRERLDAIAEQMILGEDAV